MAEYIEREALYEKAYWHGEMPDLGHPYAEGVEAVDISDVDAIPAADVAPVVHGRWENNHCTNCGTHKPYDRDGVCCGNWALNYCPNRGAKMDAEA